MRQIIVSVVSNIIVCEGVFEMTFEWKNDATPPLPGQFCTIQVSQTTSPLLRRPFAFSGFDRNAATVSIVYKKRGPATEILASKAPGETIDVIGPLGNSFTHCSVGTTSILVAGGTGFGPVLFWQRYLLDQNHAEHTVLGAKSKEHLPRRTGADTPATVVCTEDGSEGFLGTAVDYLWTLPPSLWEGAVLFCCGPTLMLKACFDFAEKRGLNCFISMEQIMACGIGACMGCAVKVHGDTGFARVCTEGPVFNGKTIVWT